MPNINLSEKSISLDLQHQGFINTIYAQQGDVNSRRLTISLYDDGTKYNIPKNATVSLCGTRADNTVIYRDVNSFDQNVVTINFENAELAVKGIAKYKIEIKTIENGETKLLTSSLFKIKVYENIYDEDGKIASPQYSDLQRELDKIHEQENAIKEAEKNREQAEEIRKNSETERVNNENKRKQTETERINAENDRITEENKRQQRESVRVESETQRNASEAKRQKDTATAISNAEKATKSANDATTKANKATDNLQNKLDSHHFVLTEDKDVAGGVPSLDSNAKVPVAELYEATTTSKGITQLTDSVTSDSTTTAATPNSVKTVNDNLNDEKNRAKDVEKTIADNLSAEIARAKDAEKINADNISAEISRATDAENTISNNLSSEVTRATNSENNLDSKKADKVSVYTKNEVDNKFSTLETNIDWKESVATYDDIATTYPNPVDGWTVNVKDTDYTYRYNGTSWVAISANAIPKATNSVDGLLSKEDHANYDDANSKKHTHSNKSVLDGISSSNISNWNSAKTHADSTHARTDATKVEKSSTNGNIKINGTETVVYTHPSGTNPHGTTKSDVGLGNVPNVATNDQTPSYTEATTLTKLTTGEELSIAFGKISKAITDLISHIGDSVKHITSTERTNWNTAKTHADSAHAPSNAQVNVIETVKVNGTALTPSSKAVNVTVPTKVSELTNDSGYKSKCRGWCI